MRYFFHIGYVGTRYRGWQKFDNIRSVQGEIEKSISQIFKREVTIVGCGRTDAGVHATQFFFHSDLPVVPDFDLKFRLNKNLPDDISVYDIIPVTDDAHARFDATARTYDFHLHCHKDPFLDQFSTWCDLRDLHFDRMKEATQLLLRYNDFRGFCKTPAKYKSAICRVSTVSLNVDAAGRQIWFNITANRFLSGMIRILLHHLIEVGKGAMPIDAFEEKLAKAAPSENVVRVAPNGLFLSRVIYPYFDLEPHSAIHARMTSIFSDVVQ